MREAQRTSWSRLARPTLAVVVLLQAAGLVLTTLKQGTSVGSWLFMEARWSEQASIHFERGAVLLSVLACLVAIFARGPLRLLGAGLASAWYATLALMQWRMGGEPFSHLALLAHSSRIAAPLLLAVLDRRALTAWVLRLAVAGTFLAHGYEAWNLHPAFIDYLLSADMRLFKLGLTQPGAEALLHLIGIHDFIIAALTLGWRNFRALLLGAAGWGVITALARIVHGGEGALHLALIRAANGGLPLVLFLLSRPAPVGLSLLGLRPRLSPTPSPDGAGPALLGAPEPSDEARPAR